MSDNILKQDIPVLYLDTELSNKKQAIRRCAQQTGLKIKDVERFKWVNDPKAVKKINEYREYVKKRKLHYVTIKGWSLERQISIIRRFYSQIVGKRPDGKYNKGVVVLDYLKLMNPKDKGADKEYEALGYRMSALHDLMEQFNNPILMFGQQNREGILNQGEETVAGSDRITWLCDNFTIFAVKNDVEMASIRETQDDDDNEHQKLSNCKLLVKLGRDGSGTPDRQYIGVYADIHDPSLGNSNGCGIIKERSMEVSITK
jgi:ASC-1-like (ASCH) protein